MSLPLLALLPLRTVFRRTYCRLWKAWGVGSSILDEMDEVESEAPAIKALGSLENWIHWPELPCSNHNPQFVIGMILQMFLRIIYFLNNQLLRINFRQVGSKWNHSYWFFSLCFLCASYASLLLMRISTYCSHFPFQFCFFFFFSDLSYLVV